LNSRLSAILYTEDVNVIQGAFPITPSLACEPDHFWLHGWISSDRHVNITP